MAPSSAPRRTQELRPRQRRVLEAARAFQARHGYPPTRAELGQLLGVSAQTADYHLRVLARQGYLSLSRQARALEFAPLPPGPASAGPSVETKAQKMRPVPLLGRVAAGRPLLAVENIESTLPLPAAIGADFALRVQGDSMIEAGILDGDLVLVKSAAAADKGEIVVALLGEGEETEATVKRYWPERGRVRLRPANAALRDFVVARDQPFALAGRVVGVLRFWK